MFDKNAYSDKQAIDIRLVDRYHEEQGWLTIFTDDIMPSIERLDGRVKISESVPWCRNDDELREKCSNKQIPIVLLEKSKNDLPNILLLENTRYYLQITPDELMFEEDGLKSFNVKKVPRSNNIYYVSFNDYAGRGQFKIKDCLPVVFEVRSSKIDYFMDYPRMISDISEFYTALALHSDTPLSRQFSEGKHKDTYYEEFILIEAMFSNKKLVDNFGYIREHIHETLISEECVSHNCDAYCIDPGSLISMVTNDCLAHRESGCICNEYEPTYVINTNYIESYDNPENQLIKEFLLTLSHILKTIDLKAKGAGQLVKSLIKTRIKETEYMLSDLWLKDVGKLDRIPFNSTVLTQKHGYRDIFEMYLMLETGLSFKINDAKEIFEGNVNKISKVYEYWCYVQIHNSLCYLDAQHPDFKKGFVLANNDWNVSIEKGHSEFKIEWKGQKHSVALHYNESTGKDSSIHSYSRILRPDFTLIVDGKHIIHLDAKYKLKIIKPNHETDDVESESTPLDLYKMHTYRDAIYHCCASFILYPGTKTDKQLNRPREWYSKKIFDDSRNWDIPSVGSIILNPQNHSVKNFGLTLLSLIMKSTVWDTRPMIENGEMKFQ